MATMNSYNHNVVKFNEQKTSWENAIHLYKGPDPLEYWYHYVNWYEQNYCYDATNRMPDLLQKVLSQFNAYNAYKQDHRLVKVWLKYVELQSNPLNIFQNLYQRGVGTQLSFFYIAWANCYLKENDFKLAESAINWGFQAQAKPLEDLQSAQQQVANSYYEYTQLQRPGPYQIVVPPQHPVGHPQPPLPAQVATNQTNYQHSAFLRDKRKLEDTFPVQSNVQAAPPVKRSRPNEDAGDYNNAHHHHQHQYAAASHHYHHNSPVHVAASPKLAHFHNNNYGQQQQHQQVHYVQPPMIGGGGGGPVDNGKVHQGLDGVTYHQQQQAQIHYTHDPHHQQSQVAAVHPAQHHHPATLHQNFHHQQQQSPAVYRQSPYPSINSNNPQHTEMNSSNGYHHHHPHHQPQQQQQQDHSHQQGGAVNGFGSGDGYVSASAGSHNYAYDNYRPCDDQIHGGGTRTGDTHVMYGGGGSLIEETVVEEEEEVVDEEIEGTPSSSQEFGDSPPAIQIPANFARSATNSHNFWRAPLYLEEPYVNQRPMYVKPLVYPQPVAGGTHSEYEFSFEELRAKRRAEEKQLQQQAMEAAAAVDLDTYEEYWTEEVTVQQADEASYGEFVQQQQAEQQLQGHGNGGGVFYHVMQPKGAAVVVQQQQTARGGGKPSGREKKRKEKRKKMVVKMINDTEDEEEDEDENEDDEEVDHETTTIRYTCDQNGLTGGSGGNGTTPRRITIKLRKQVATPGALSTPSNAAAKATPKVPYGGAARNGNGNGYGTGLYRRTATDADADLLLSLGNGQSGFYQEMREEDSCTGYAEFNNATSYNYASSGIGENSNNSCTTPAPTEPSTPISSGGGARLATSTPSAYRRLTKHRSNVSLLNEDSLNNENSFLQAELDEEVKSRRLARAVATVEEHLRRASIDPFNADLCKALLTKIGFPSTELCDVYRMVQQPLPKLANAKQVLLGDTYYNVEREVGRGTYGAVYKAANAYTGATVAIKLQKPANSWELYICTEIKKRIKYHAIMPGFMDITSAVLAPNGCVLISEFSPYGSLLDINNKIRQATTRVMHESLVMHFTTQILDIVHYLHECRIIHADIKPDNFLIMKAPNSSSPIPTMRLIDFGCAIDMDLFPENTKFKKVIQTEGFTCTEMKENRPWTYQTDLYCVAATVHVMLFGEYMQVAKKFGIWEIKQKLPRYLKKNVWMDFFNRLLNIPDCDNLPNLLELREAIDNEVYAMDSELQKHIRTLTNLLFKR